MAADEQDTRSEEVIVIPLVAETVHVEKLSQVTDRVVVTTHVEAETFRIDAPRVVETIQVERVAIGRRRVEGPIPVRHEGDTTIISVVEEIAVVEKHFFLREEVRVTKRRVEEPQHADVTVHREVATIERMAPPDAVEDE